MAKNSTSGTTSGTHKGNGTRDGSGTKGDGIRITKGAEDKKGK